jgi:ATP-binding cassette subfamily B (MDR/TAP) protein 1
MCGIGVAIWIFSFFYWSSLMIFAEKVTRRIKYEYLKAIFRQDCAWFDNCNYTELASKMKKETDSIQKAIGEKIGTLIFSVGMCLCGLTIGFTKGWSYSLALFALLPPVMIAAIFLGVASSTGVTKVFAAYSQSAGYADQALNAIRVVVSFGQEETEIKNYNKYLERAKKAGESAGLTLNFALGFFLFIIYAAYAYAFWMGGIYIYNHVYNPLNDGPYTGGDVISCFFGILFGLIAILSASNNLKGLLEGKIAGKNAFDIIKRNPQIDLDDPTVEDHILDGEIEFHDVVFYYPTRADTQVLNNFSI